MTLLIDRKRFTGLRQIASEDGEIVIEEQYLDGERHGQAKSALPSLTVLTYKNGKKHGISEEFYQNGKLSRRSFFDNGVKHGLSENFNEDGDLVEMELWRNSKRVVACGRDDAIRRKLPIYVESLGRYATPDDEEYPSE